MDTTANISHAPDACPETDACAHAAQSAASHDAQDIRLYGAVPDSIVDGPGLRYAVFVQGCTHACPGCHNPESQPCEGGTLTTVDAVFEDIRANGLVHDVTLSGGEPFEQAAACAHLARKLKQAGYGVWAYSGYLFEDLDRIASQASEDQGAEGERGDAPAAGNGAGAQGTPSPAKGVSLLDAQGVADLLDCVDVLVDGPFIESRKSLSLKWCGSSNQRLVDVAATRRAGRIVTWKPAEFTFTKPESW